MCPRQIRSRTPAPRWQIHFFERRRDADPNERVPGRELLEACPDKVPATMAAVSRTIRSRGWGGPAIAIIDGRPVPRHTRGGAAGRSEAS
jgi:hypothetical protein